MSIRSFWSIVVLTTTLYRTGEAAQLQLRWTDNAVDEDGFAVERRLGAAGFVQVAVLGPDLTSYVDLGLTSAVTYCYRVRAFNAAGDSPYSNEACGTPTVTGQAEPRLITGPGAGGGPLVRGFTAAGAATTLDFFAYNPNFAGGVFIAAAKMDGAAAIITGAGPGGGPHVQAFRFSGAPTGISFMAYDPTFTGGSRVAACDVDGDGEPEIVTGAGPGGGPHVRVWKLAGSTVREVAGFFAYAPSFTGGVFVACGDLDGDGRAEIITGAGPGGGPHVRVWQVDGSGTVHEVTGFFAYAPTFAGGVFVAAGDVDGSGRAAIITGAGPGGGPHVRVWQVDGSGTVREVTGFFAYAPAFTGGVHVATSDLDGDGRAELVTGAGPGAGPHVRTFSVQGPAVIPGLSFFAYEPAFTGGVFVAGAP